MRRLRREVRILREEREILRPPREVADFTGARRRRPPSSLEKTVQAVETFGQVGAGEGPPRGSADVPGIEGLPQRVLRVARSQAESAEGGGPGAAGADPGRLRRAAGGRTGLARVWAELRACGVRCGRKQLSPADAGWGASGGVPPAAAEVDGAGTPKRHRPRTW